VDRVGLPIPGRRGGLAAASGRGRAGRQRLAGPGTSSPRSRPLAPAAAADAPVQA